MEEAIEDLVSSSAITAPLLVTVSEGTSVSVGAAAAVAAGAGAASTLDAGMSSRSSGFKSYRM